MSSLRRYLLICLAIIFLAAAIGPFLVPIPPLTGTVPIDELADADSQFINIDGMSIHVKTMGEGEPVFVLLHGFGASLYSWNSIMAPLGKNGTVIAFDRPAFGLTERPLKWIGENPYSPESQIRLIEGLMNHFQVEKAILVGNSAGGSLAMQAALTTPSSYQALILVDPAVYTGGGAPSWVKPLLALPQFDHIGPLIARQLQEQGSRFLELAFHDPSRISEETIKLYQKPTKVENWDVALWEFTLASRSPEIIGRLNELVQPILVITGDDDRIVPTEESIRLAGELPNASLKIIKNAGHLPQEEQPEEFMQAIVQFLDENDLGSQKSPPK